MTAEQRAKELAQFFGMSEADALAKLNLGFGHHHAEVTADWKRANPQTDEEILEWYRTTPSYVWELSAYHLDPGFNYMGMCTGISGALRAKGVTRALCLGDGIGDLTIKLRLDGLESWYHDLAYSKTFKFAAQRHVEYVGRNEPGLWFENLGADPVIGGPNGFFPEYFDAVISLDFLEHVTDVEAWVRAIYAALKPGGWLMAQNAFACGSGPNGSIPCHLERNDRFEKDWDPLLSSIGFVQESSNWYRKPELWRRPA